MKSTKDKIQHSHNHKHNWFKDRWEGMWEVMGYEINYRRVDIAVKIGGGLLLSWVIFWAGQHAQQQSYYSSLLDKYIASIEQLLIQDTLELGKLREKPSDGIPTKDTLESGKQQSKAGDRDSSLDFIESNIHSLVRVNTEVTLSSLSKDDGLVFGLFNNNRKRRQFLINFLRNSQLGFKDRDTGKPLGRSFDKIFHKLNLYSLDLKGVNLSLAILPNADLSKANLQKAIFSESDLQGVRLFEAKLQGADLSQVNLTGANLTGANLTGAILNKAVYDSKTQWPEKYDYKKSGAIGPKANLKGVDLRKLNLTGVDLTEVDLTEADLTEADLTEADLTEADLTGANLTGANLTGAKGANYLTKSKLCNTTLPDKVVSMRDCPKKV